MYRYCQTTISATVAEAETADSCNQVFAVKRETVNYRFMVTLLNRVSQVDVEFLS